MFIDVGTRKNSPTKRNDDLSTAMPLGKANMDKECFETVVSELNSGTFVLSHQRQHGSLQLTGYIVVILFSHSHNMVKQHRTQLNTCLGVLFCHGSNDKIGFVTIKSADSVLQVNIFTVSRHRNL